MSQDNFSAQIIGVFFAETVKNVAKGSANLIYNNFNLLFYSEITALGLNEAINAEQITEQLRAKPEILETVRQKLNAHPRLAEEMTKTVSSSNVTNARDIILSSVSSHNQSGGQTAHTIINNNAPPSVTVRQIKVDVSHNLQQAYDGLEIYRLTISLTNTGSEPISNYRFEIEFPRVYLNDSTLINFEKVDKITQEYRFFRITCEDRQSEPLYPDDKRVIFSPSYEYSGRNPYNDILRIKVYVDEQLLRNIEKPMSELLNT